MITTARLLLVPLVVVAIVEDRLDIAFWLFVVAGVSDGIDGWIARRWDLRSVLGAYLDAIADKTLLVAIYITLGIQGELPRWLVIVVVSRDLLIVGAFMLSWIMAHPVKLRPLLISKLNTGAQIALAAVVLGNEAFDLKLSSAIFPVVLTVATLTIASGTVYLLDWLRVMSAGGRNGDGGSHA